MSWMYGIQPAVIYNVIYARTIGICNVFVREHEIWSRYVNVVKMLLFPNHRLTGKVWKKIKKYYLFRGVVVVRKPFSDVSTVVFGVHAGTVNSAWKRER
jgi:hypothetical protein